MASSVCLRCSSGAGNPSCYLNCHLCQATIHISCLQTPLPTSLLSDTFFNLECCSCSPNKIDTLSRSRMSWLNVTLLALYNLHLDQNYQNREGYFHWRKDICEFISRHWVLLWGAQMKKKKTWTGTVSGSLSGHVGLLFESGVQHLAEPGWWRLVSLEPAQDQLLRLLSLPRASVNCGIISTPVHVQTPTMLGKRSSRLSQGNSSIANAIALKQKRDMINDLVRKPKNVSAEKKKGAGRPSKINYKKNKIKVDGHVLEENKKHVSEVMCNVKVIGATILKQEESTVSNIESSNNKSLLNTSSNKCLQLKSVTPSGTQKHPNFIFCKSSSLTKATPLAVDRVSSTASLPPLPPGTSLLYKVVKPCNFLSNSPKKSANQVVAGSSLLQPITSPTKPAWYQVVSSSGLTGSPNLPERLFSQDEEDEDIQEGLGQRTQDCMEGTGQRIQSCMEEEICRSHDCKEELGQWTQGCREGQVISDARPSQHFAPQFIHQVELELEPENTDRKYKNDSNEFKFISNTSLIDKEISNTVGKELEIETLCDSYKPKDILSQVSKEIELKDELCLDDYIEKSSDDDQSIVDAIMNEGPLPELSQLVGGVEDKDFQALTISNNKNDILSQITEWEEQKILSKLVHDINFHHTSLVARQLFRKLKIRKLLRSKGMTIFDLDKQANTFVGLIGNKTETPKIEAKIERVLDRFLGASRTCLKILLVGGGPSTGCVKSPYTGQKLKPYIRQDGHNVPPKLSLLRCIQSRGDHPTVENFPIDYCYLQPNHIPAINQLARDSFWPDIDVSEALQYPDFSCVVLYKRLVIGFSVLVPDVNYNEAYLSFLLTHPEWRRSGIGTFMLYHIIQTCMGKDITLHVSANNPAMLLYQKFGFKVEEVVKDFYDKYLPPDSKECKHALFLRLHR